MSAGHLSGKALFALEKEGTVVMEPFKGATLKPLSPEEALDIAELRLSLITLAIKPAHRHLSPADFDLAYRLANSLGGVPATGRPNDSL
jgi:DNA-binding GntR family transcriptional regulator